jgi:predicted metal-dependent phosphoesterase TrpH
VDRRRATPEEAIAMIRAAGGVAVLAHAGQLKRSMQEVRRITAGLAAAGLGGIEVWHPDHSADDMRALAVLARQLGLAATGGTDYHGHVREDVRLGVGRGNLAVGYDAVEAIRRRLVARSG